MANTFSKISPFPGCPNPLSAGDMAGAPETGDPTKELRSFIEGLQNEARLARSRQEVAEEERDRLVDEVRRFQQERDAAESLRKEVRELAAERDGLLSEREKEQALSNEVRRKADSAERLRVQMESQRDQAINLYKEFRKEVDQHVAARDEAIRQRDAAQRQKALLAREHEELSKRLAESQRQVADSQKSLIDVQQGASKRPDGEAQKQIAALRLARDHAAAQVAEMRVRIAELEDEVANAIYDREVSDKATQRAVMELEAFRAQAESDAQKAALLGTLQAELAEVSEELTLVRGQYASAQGAKEQLLAQLREFRDTHTNMVVSNTSRMEIGTKERDLLRARLQERESELAEVRAELAAAWAGAMQVTEPEIERLTKELEGMKSRSAEVDDFAAKYEEMAKQREDMRLQVIELNAQLENARREIKEIGALLAESRLQNKLSGKAPTAFAALPKTTAPSSPEESVESDDESAFVEETKPTIGEAVEVAVDRLEAMRTAFDHWNETPGDQGLLWNLARETAAYCGSNQAEGEQILQQVSGKLAAWLEAMLEAPGKGSEIDVRTVRQAISFLDMLERTACLDQIVHIFGSRVYVVDDDPDVCAMISEVLMTAGFEVVTTEHPSTAIAELAQTSYDLILLDVRLPEVDGFELCGYIRGLEPHSATPILYVTGVAEVDSENPSGSSFVGKPFHPAELSLRAMMAVIGNQLITT